MKRTNKMLAIMVILAMLISYFVPLTAFAEEKQISITVNFQNTSDADEGCVQYNKTNDESNWQNLNSGANTITYDSTQPIRIRIVPNDDYEIDWAATSYRVIRGSTEENPIQVNGDTGLQGFLENGYSIDASITAIMLEGVEFREETGENPPVGGETQRIYIVDFGTASYTVGETTVTASVEGATDYTNVQLQEETIITLTNFNPDTMEVIVSGSDNYNTKLTVNNNQTSLINRQSNGGIPDGVLFFSVAQKSNNGGQGGNNTQNYNTTATINYSVNGVIEYDEGPFEGLGINFSINGVSYKPNENNVNYTEDTAYERDDNGQLILDENNNPIVIKDPDTMQPMTEITGVIVTGDTIHYDSDSNKVRFVFIMNPGTLMTGLKINNQTINNLPSTAVELEACYNDHMLKIEVENIDKADTYNIEIEARYPNSNEEFMGNFLWDYNPQGYTGPDDKILNATMTFVEAEYNGHKYTTVEEIKALGGVYIWNDAVRKKVYTEEREGCGEAQFPVGTMLTVKIIPDAGYQLVDFGINGGLFEPQEEIGTYTFEVKGGPFHLQATIAQVEDVVKTESEKVSAGNIELGGTEDSMAIGTARLDVKDIELNEDQISNFEEAANGYDIKSYLDISLYNTVFKGEEDKSWDTQVRDLDNEATITLQLEDGVDGNEVVIVHEKHDGTYEIIPVEYDPETNTITFRTKSFSNYAIATRDAVAGDTTTDNNNSQSPKTGDNIQIYVAVFAIATIGAISIKNKKNKLNRKH